MRISKKQQILSLVTVLSIALLGLVSYSTYKYGYNRGKKDEAARQSATASINDTFKKSTELFSRTASGTIRAVSSKEINVKLKTGKEQRIGLTDKTKVLENGKTVTTKELKPNQKVSIILSEINQKQAARISILE